MDIVQQELNETIGRLNAREVELAQIHNENQRIPELQQKLNDALQQLETREEQIRQFQITTNDHEASQAHQQAAQLQQQLQEQAEEIVINMNDEFSRGRVPDLIRGLPQFSGNAKQLSQWIQSVERILNLYKHLEHTPLFPLWLQEIRNKVIGEAGDLLASNGTPLVWISIKNELTIHYGDKRELSTLLQKLFSSRQNRCTVNEFYAQIQDCFTGISTQIQMSSEWRNPADLVKFVDKLCLEKFIDGLEEPYTSHVGILQPKTLNQAFQFAIEKANKLARRTGDYDINNKAKINQPNKAPPVPVRYHYPQQFQNIQRPNQFVRPQYNPQYAPQIPRNFQTPQSKPFYSNRPQNLQNSQSKPFYPNKPNAFNSQFAQVNSYGNANFGQSNFKPPQKVEPMDVDHSIRSRQVNYMNRPNQQPFLHYNIEEMNSNEENFQDSFENNDWQNACNPESVENDFITPPQNDNTQYESDSKNNSNLPDTDDLNFHLGHDFINTT